MLVVAFIIAARRDLDDLREDIDDDEYEETRKDTMEQLSVRLLAPSPVLI